MRGKMFVHFRRCHVCGSVSERDCAWVDRCDCCGKLLAPYYFFDEDSIRVDADNRQRPLVERERRNRRASGEDPRWMMRGFSTVWK